MVTETEAGNTTANHNSSSLTLGLQIAECFPISDASYPGTVLTMKASRQRDIHYHDNYTETLDFAIETCRHPANSASASRIMVLTLNNQIT